MTTTPLPRADAWKDTDVTTSATPTKLLLTVEEAAQHLGVGRTLMYSLIGSGTVESVTIGRLRRVRPVDLARYADALAATSRAA